MAEWGFWTQAFPGLTHDSSPELKAFQLSWASQPVWSIVFKGIPFFPAFRIFIPTCWYDADAEPGGQKLPISDILRGSCLFLCPVNQGMHQLIEGAITSHAHQPEQFGKMEQINWELS